MKIGLFFGTFNPVHLGHEEIVSQLLDLNLFDQIWIILTPNSPHKNFDIVKKEERFYMLRKAFENFKNIEISDVEFNLKKHNYTIDTLNYIGEQLN